MAGIDSNSGTERTSGNVNELMSGIEATGAGVGIGITIDPGMEPIGSIAPMGPIETIAGISTIWRRAVEGALRGATAGASARSVRKYAVLVQSGASSSSDTIASHREKKVHSAHGTHTSGPTSSMQPWLCITWKAAQPLICSHSSAQRETSESRGR